MTTEEEATLVIAYKRATKRIDDLKSNNKILQSESLLGKIEEEQHNAKDLEMKLQELGQSDLLFLRKQAALSFFMDVSSNLKEAQAGVSRRAKEVDKISSFIKEVSTKMCRSVDSIEIDGYPAVLFDYYQLEGMGLEALVKLIDDIRDEFKQSFSSHVELLQAVERSKAQLNEMAISYQFNEQ